MSVSVAGSETRREIFRATKGVLVRSRPVKEGVLGSFSPTIVLNCGLNTSRLVGKLDAALMFDRDVSVSTFQHVRM